MDNDLKTARNSLDSGFAKAACDFDFYVELEYQRMLMRKARAYSRSSYMRTGVALTVDQAMKLATSEPERLP